MRLPVRGKIWLYFDMVGVRLAQLRGRRPLEGNYPNNTHLSRDVLDGKSTKP